MASHPIHRRLWAEDLMCARRASERERYGGSQRRGRIDPNPHQLNGQIERLEARLDPEYEMSRHKAHQRRYRTVERARALDVELVLQ